MLQPNSANPSGAYSIKLFEAGEWRYSLIEDLIPVNKNILKPWSWYTKDNKLLWHLLIEKHISNMNGE